MEEGLAGLDVEGGTLLALAGPGDVPFVEEGFAVICPFAVVILFVKEEMAQPVQVSPSLGTGVPMRGVAPLAAVAPAAGCTVSGRVAAYRLMRVR